MHDENRGLGDRAYYEKWYSSRGPEFYRWILTEIIAHGKPGSLLDLGCGTGLLLSLAADWGIRAEGCEGSEDAVAIARQRDPRIQITCSVFSKPLPMAANSFDNVLLNQVIEHLPASVFEELLRETHRVLRPGGMLFIYSPSRANRKEVLSDPTHVNALLPSELRRAVERAGFETRHEPNTPFFAGNNRLLSFGCSLLMRLVSQDRFSSSANIHARKP